MPIGTPAPSKPTLHSQLELEARVGIGLKRGRIRFKNTNVYGLVKHYAVTSVLQGFYYIYTQFYTQH